MQLSAQVESSFLGYHESALCKWDLKTLPMRPCINQQHQGKRLISATSTSTSKPKSLCRCDKHSMTLARTMVAVSTPVTVSITMIVTTC